MLISGHGTDKTHVATALDVQAVEHHRKKVRFRVSLDAVLGRASMTAEELMSLEGGALISLESSFSDHVELYLGGALVALARSRHGVRRHTGRCGVSPLEGV